MSRGDKYESVREQAERGKELLVDPLDYLILDKLPEQGTLMGGLIPIGETVRNLINAPNSKFAQLTSEILSGRLNSLNALGYVVAVKMIGSNSKRNTHSGAQGWQITPAGQAKLTEWKLAQAPDETNEEVSD